MGSAVEEQKQIDCQLSFSVDNLCPIHYLWPTHKYTRDTPTGDAHSIQRDGLYRQVDIQLGNCAPISEGPAIDLQHPIVSHSVCNYSIEWFVVMVGGALNKAAFVQTQLAK